MQKKKMKRCESFSVVFFFLFWYNLAVDLSTFFYCSLFETEKKNKNTISHNDIANDFSGVGKNLLW